MNRIIIKELILAGKGKQDAVLSFKQGLNVIAGDSDTGKTFILQCIDYAFGASDRPKSIEEASGYSKIILAFDVEGDNFRIERRIGEKKVLFIKNNVRQEISSKHSSDGTDNLSRQLLGALKGDLENVYLKKNKKNATRSLSFRDLIHLAFIDEHNIISEISPFQAAQYTEKTVRQSILKYIITGVDDSKLIKEQELRHDLIKRSGIVHYLESKKEIIQKKISKIKNNAFYRLYEKDDSVTLMEKKIEQVRCKMVYSIKQLNQNKIEVESLNRKCFEDEVEILNFERLKKDFAKDLERLDLINLYTDFINQVPRLDCPVCQQAIDPKIIDESGLNRLFAYFKMKALNLKEKSQGLALSLTDVKNRLDENKEKIKKLNKIALELNGEINEQEKMLLMFNENIKTIQRLDMMRNSLEMYEVELKTVIEDIAFYSRKEKEEREPQKIDNSELFDEYCKEVKLVLGEWGVQCDAGVSFSFRLLDVYVNNTIRADHGKGYRAFISAAMVIALMRFCFKHNRLHPGFVMLDSPLVSLKERRKDEVGDWVNDYMEKKMIEDILKEDACHQVIIVENKNIRYGGQYNYVDFRHVGAGRRGFIPS